MKYLVTGGAGYIGSIVTEELLQAGHSVTVVDNLSTGYRGAVPEGADFVQLDIRETRVLTELMSRDYAAVLHFAASSIVGESMNDPVSYFENNIVGCTSLLRAMVDAKVLSLVFSSSAAVYGEPDEVPILESSPLRPGNPYGLTKKIMEEMMQAASASQGLAFVSLRYFNAAGASLKRGEWHRPETHLIPIILEVAAGKRASLEIFGDDYPTRDGTCVRDYIHVLDLASAHVLALEAIDRGVSGAFNLGNGRGFSVLEIVHEAERVTGRSVPHEIGGRRAGDPSALVASSRLAEESLKWKPKFAEVGTIIESAWRWMESHPGGYSSRS